MGRPAHLPDAQTRRNVEALAGYGVPEAEIAGVVGIDAKTLRKHYRWELDHGHTKANARVAENLFRKATGEGREPSLLQSSGSRREPVGRKPASTRPRDRSS
jgi:hypothetical protein